MATVKLMGEPRRVVGLMDVRMVGIVLLVRLSLLVLLYYTAHQLESM